MWSLTPSSYPWSLPSPLPKVQLLLEKDRDGAESSLSPGRTKGHIHLCEYGRGGLKLMALLNSGAQLTCPYAVPWEEEVLAPTWVVEGTKDWGMELVVVVVVGDTDWVPGLDCSADTSRYRAGSSHWFFRADPGATGQRKEQDWLLSFISSSVFPSPPGFNVLHCRTDGCTHSVPIS